MITLYHTQSPSFEEKDLDPVEELLEDVEGELAEVEMGVEKASMVLIMALGGVFFLAFGSTCWWIR